MITTTLKVLLLINLFYISFAVETKLATQPELIISNFEGTKTFLYRFCLPLEGVTVLDQNLALHIESEENINYIAIDWHGTSHGFDFIFHKMNEKTFYVPVLIDLQPTSGWSPSAEEIENLSGYIVSDVLLSELSVKLSTVSNYVTSLEPCTGSCELKTCGVSSHVSSYPVGCDGLPSFETCSSESKLSLITENQTSSSSSPSYEKPNVALSVMGLVLVFSLAGCFYLVLIKIKIKAIKEEMIEMEIEDIMVEQECDDIIDEFVGSPVRV